MKIDLKWALPFVLPLAVAASIKALAALMGVEWAVIGREVVTILSWIGGFLAGCVALAKMHEKGVRLDVDLSKLWRRGE